MKRVLLGLSVFVDALLALGCLLAGAVTGCAAIVAYDRCEWDRMAAFSAAFCALHLVGYRSRARSKETAIQLGWDSESGRNAR